MMTMQNKYELITNYLDELYPNAFCELLFNKDYELLMAVVMSAQTTDKRVNSVTPLLFNKYKDLKALKEAKIEDIEEIIKPIGTFHKKAIFIKEIAKVLDEEYEGIVPNNRKILETLPGVGRKTTNVVLSVLYNEPAIAVDTHVERVSKRLKIAKEEDNVLQVEKKLMKFFPKERWIKTHHQLIFYGRYHCKATSPNCNDCKLREICKYKKNKRR